MGGTDGAVDLRRLFNGLARASLVCLAGHGKRRKAPWVGPFNHNLMAWPCRHWLKGCCMARSEAAPASGDGLPANRRSDLMRVFSVVLGETARPRGGVLARIVFFFSRQTPYICQPQHRSLQIAGDGI